MFLAIFTKKVRLTAFSYANIQLDKMVVNLLVKYLFIAVSHVALPAKKMKSIIMAVAGGLDPL